MTPNIDPNVERFMGFADCYDTFRPQPPTAIVDLLAQLAQVERPACVVDLGCGTGLSTRIWAGRAESIIGIEPSADMRRMAEEHTAEACPDAAIRFQKGFSHETGLPDGCAEIVTACQALHWMEPEPTFAEVARILRPGGVFAAIDCDWPPAMNWEAEIAYRAFSKGMGELEKRLGITEKIRRWSKDQHLERMRESGRFRYTRELLLHQVEMGSAERLVGLALSFGGVRSVLKKGLSEAEIGLDILQKEAKRTLGDAPQPWYFSYRVRIGIR